MREIDRRTTAECGVPELMLMENAGAAVFAFLSHKFGPLRDHRIAVICGKGNNGGDGLVVARHLHTRGQCGKLSVVLAAERAMLEGTGVDCPVQVVRSENEWEAALGVI